MTLDDREVMKQLFGPTTECLPIEKLTARWDAGFSDAKAHLESCTYCASQRAGSIS